MVNLFRELILFYRKQQESAFTFKLFIFLLVPDAIKSRLIAITESSTDKEYLKKYAHKSFFQKEFLCATTLNESVRKHLLLKLHHHLREEDKSSMRFGVESRVPFLEYKLVEFGLHTPARFKIHEGEVKYILKEAMRDLLPNLIYRRNNKIGHEAPIDEWLRQPNLSSYVEGVFRLPDQPMASRLNIPFIKKKWEAHRAGRANYGNIIWKYIYLTRWYQLYFKEK